MDILFVTEYFPNSSKGEISGGVEARCFYMAKILARKHKVRVITSWQEGQKRKQKFSGINVLRVGPRHPYSNRGGFFSRFGFAYRAMQAIERQKDVDIVDGFNFTSYIPAYIGARNINAKAVATYHETWIGKWISNKGFITGLVGELLERITIALNWDLIIPVSNFTKRELAKVGIKRNIMKVVYNGVHTDYFKKIKEKKHKNFTIVAVSRLVKTKRIQILLKALTHVKDVNLIVVGSGDDATYMKAEAKRLGVNKRVKFLGFLKTKEEVAYEIKSADIFCLPSAVEGFGITVVEAMASGVPVICSDIPPLMEVTNKGEYGLIFKLDDDKELASQIKLLKNNKKRYAELQKKGLKRVEFFDWESVTKKYLQVIK